MAGLFSAPFFAFSENASALACGVPLRQDAEHIVEFRPIPGAGFLQPHRDFVAGVQHHDHALAVVTEGHPAASFHGALQWCHRRYFTKRTFPEVAFAAANQRLTTRHQKGNKSLTHILRAGE